MSRAKDLNCRCRYKLPEAALRIPLLNVTGKHGPEAMLFAPICTRSQAPFRMRPPLDMGGDPDEGDPEYGEVWRLEADDSLIFVEGDPARTFTVKTTVTSFAPGGIVTELRYTDVDGLIARYENDYAYAPHRGCTMRLVDYDPTGGNDRAVDWMDYCCLRPAMQVEVGDCAECFNVDGLTVADYSFLYVVEPGNYSDDGGPNECDCEHASRAMAGMGGGSVCDYGEERTECDGVFGYNLPVTVSLRPVSPTSAEIWYGIGDAANFLANHFAITTDRSACDISRFGGEFELTWAGVDPWPCDNDAPVKVTIIPLTANGEVRTSGVPCGPKYCGGVSGWNLVEKCRANDTAIYKWVKVTEAACKGECSDDSCRATQPFQLQGAMSLDGESERLTDDDATDLGYRALVEGAITVDGGCDCDPAPTTPVCETGCSVWTLDVDNTCNGGDLYFWRFKNSSCGGSCESDTCIPTIPESPVLSLSPVTDPTLAAQVGTDFVGGCDCGATPYVIPECPECTCDDVTLDKTFTISGLTGDWEIYNDTFTIEKHYLGPCDEMVDCCWGGAVGNPDVNIQFVWVAGVWTLTITSAFADGATYTLAADDPCGNPLVLTKSSGDSHMPGTITVSAAP